MNLPVALAGTLLLDVLGVDIDSAAFGKVAWEMLFWRSGAVGESDVISSVCFV